MAKKKPVKKSTPVKYKPVPKKAGKAVSSKKVTSSGKKSKAKTKKRAAPVKSKYPRGFEIYNKIQKSFAEYNRSLPEADRIPYALRKKIIKDILANFSKLPKNKATYKAIRAYIEQILSEFDSSICDPRGIDPSKYAAFPFYDLDDVIRDDMPNCVDIRVNAGIYGDTGIFNTADYSYEGSGCKAIVDTLQPFYRDSDDCPFFQGVVMVKPNRQDDNNKTSYYLEFQVQMNTGEPVELRGEGRIVSPTKISKKARAEAKLKADAKKLMNEKIKELTKKTPIRKRPIVFREETKKKEKQPKITAETFKERNRWIEALKKLHKEGYLSKKDLQAAIKQSLDLTGGQSTTPTKRMPLGKPAQAFVRPTKPTVKGKPIPPEASRFLAGRYPAPVAPKKALKKNTKKKKKW